MLSKAWQSCVERLWLEITFILIIALWLLHYHFTHPLSRVPAIHWLAPWSRAHILFTKLFYTVRYAHYDAHLNRSGSDGFRPLIRVGPNEVSIMTTQGIETAFTGRFERTPWYKVFSNFGTNNMISVSSRGAHSKRRRLLSSAYSKTSVHRPRVQNIIKSRIGKFISFVEHQITSQNASPGKSSPIIIRNVTRPLEADIFTAFAFSENEGTNFLDNLHSGVDTVDDTGMEQIDLFHDEKRDPYWFWESEFPSLFWHLFPYMRKGAKHIHAKAEKWILDLMTQYETGADAMKETPESTYGKMLVWKDFKSGKSLSKMERASEIMDDCLAGQDTIPAALEFMIRKLSQHPDVQAKLQKELLASLPLVAEQRTMAMLDSLPYLNAVVMEALRLVDTISSYQTRTVPAGGCVIEGFFLPARTVVASQPHLINRLPTVFADPETFDPSRWLLPRDAYLALAKHMWTFSSGPQGCIAKELALSIMKTFIGDIYIGYTTKLMNEDRVDKRPCERSDEFAEVQFEHLKVCPSVKHLEDEVPL